MMIFCSLVDSKSEHSKHKNLIVNEAVFAKIAENDMVAFEEFYRLTERSVYAFALSILKNHDDALDVVQDTYLRIRAAAHLYEPMGKPMAWVFTITRNLSMNKLKTRKQTDAAPLEDLENDLSFAYVTNDDDRLVLQSALKILNEQEREIILLHAVSGLKNIEIAKNMGIPISTVLTKYHRGLKKLKIYLSEQEVQ